MFIDGFGETKNYTETQLKTQLIDYQVEASLARQRGDIYWYNRYNEIVNKINNALSLQEFHQPRTRKRNSLSDGESDSEDPNIVYRSLREDERPFEFGIRPPTGCDKNKTVAQHIAAGSRSGVKSPHVSASRSRKSAAAWAAKNSGGRVARIRLPPYQRRYDMTFPEQARQVFPTLRGSSYNTAKASQEVVIPGGVGPASVISVENARKLSVSEYNNIKQQDSARSLNLVRSRTTTKSRSIPVELVPTRQIIQIQHDGHCLFRAIARVQYNRIDDNIVQHLRTMVQQRIQRDPHLREFLNTDVRRLNDLTNMHTNIVWGGDEEIQVLSLLLQRRIVVHQNGGPLTYDGVNGLLGYDSGNRYADLHINYENHHFDAIQ